MKRNIIIAAAITAIFAVISCKQKDRMQERPSAEESFKVEFTQPELGSLTAVLDGKPFLSGGKAAKGKTVLFKLEIKDDCEIKTWHCTPSSGFSFNGKSAKLIVENNAFISVQIINLYEALIEVPIPEGGMIFPIGADDKGLDDDGDWIVDTGIETGSVMYAYSIGQYEVTYGLWFRVKKWAEEHGYKFANDGLAGSEQGQWLEDIKKYENEGKAPTEQNKRQPVTRICWRDALVWCNAYSEMENKTPVYYKESSCINVLKDAGNRWTGGTYTANPQAVFCDKAKVKPDADGYRLPFVNEWQAAASWQGAADLGNSVSVNRNGKTYYFTKGSSVSGAVNAAAAGDFLWYKDNAGKSSYPVGEKKPNALNIYDMSGNVWEFCFDKKDAAGHIIKGGGWDTSLADVRLFFEMSVVHEQTFPNAGFRVAAGKTGKLENFPVPQNVKETVTVPVPAGGVEVPFDVLDTETQKAGKPFKIGKYEVTYELWTEVYEWAAGKSGNSGQPKTQYVFANKGAKGGNPAAAKEQNPVTKVSWCDAVVWCNAYSEKSGLKLVYYKDGAYTEPLTNSAEASCADAKINPAANGWRLPTQSEWQLAARIRYNQVNSVKGKSFTDGNGKTCYFTKGNSVSGAASHYADKYEVNKFVWYWNTCDSNTHTVGTKFSNDLGICDMSGNVWEWTNDELRDGSEVVKFNRGGGWKGASGYLQIGLALEACANAPNEISDDLGFRVCRNAE